MAVERPGLVILDVNLPDMSGYEVCRRIKTTRETASIPVLQVSATSHEPEAQITGLEGGAEGYLVEPIDPGVLVATAKAMLRVHSLHQEMEAEVERRRRVEEALRSRNRRLKLLSEVVSDLLWRDATPEEFVAEVYRRFSAELGLDIYFHFQVEEDGRTLRLSSWHGVSDEFAGRIEGKEFVTAAFRSVGVTASLCNPLLADGRLLGLLCFGTRSRTEFDPDEVELLQTLCSQVALALERRRLRGVLQFQASLLDQVRNAVIATDQNGKITYWNNGAVTMYGWTADEVIGRNIAEITIPHGAEEEAARILSVVAETGHWEGEFQVPRKDGTLLPAFVADAALRSAEGSVIGFVGVSVDLSEQKRAEQALREVQKFESLGYLAGGVAHNINNILVGIMGNVSLVLYAADLNADDRTLLEEAIANSERAADLTRQLLNYAGKGRFTVKPLELSSFVEGLTALFRSSIPKEIALCFKLAEAMPCIQTDEDQMRQIVSNLVINAAEAIGDRAGAIQIGTRVAEYAAEAHGPPVAVGRLTAGRYIVLRIADTGSGMDEETKARIFDPFFTTKFTGRGLGLAAVAGIVRSHNGAIGVSTAPGKGSTLEVFLPIPGRGAAFPP